MSDHDHQHAHDHVLGAGDGHGAGHAHGHAPKDFGLAFAVGTTLNLGFVVAEVVYGLLANSIALVADAGHNLGDVLGLVMAWVATILARRSPSLTHTYGLRRGTILAALANAVLLLVTIGGIFIEGIRRLIHPAEVDGVTIMIVAANGVTAWLFASGRKGDINLRAAFMHMAGDALVSIGVVVAGAIILFTSWSWLDPLTSIVIAGMILVGTWGLLRDSVGMSLDAVPAGIKSADVTQFLEQQPGVAAIHDLHIWPMSTTETALTCHCLMPAGHPGDQFLVELAQELHDRFSIGHATIQVEVSADIACALQPDHVA